jgi:hypothetical protein
MRFDSLPMSIPLYIRKNDRKCRKSRHQKHPKCLHPQSRPVFLPAPSPNPLLRK